jgi:uncharacterized protein YjbI with pentapeptide repeats
MIDFDVKNRFTGDVQFSANIDCSEGDAHPLKMGLAVKWALDNGAYLNGAYLGGAYLEGAYLGRANLGRAYLGGADLEGVNGVNEYIKCVQIEAYPITYTADILQIGCERHPIENWRTFDSRRIAAMDGKCALKFWAKYKNWIFQTIELCPAKPTGASQ